MHVFMYELNFVAKTFKIELKVRTLSFVGSQCDQLLLKVTRLEAVLAKMVELEASQDPYMLQVNILTLIFTLICFK